MGTANFLILNTMKKFIIFLLFMPQLFYGQWVLQVSGTTENLNDVFAVTEDLVFAVGDNGTILKTTDGGTTWVAKTSGTTQNLTKIKFANQNVGFAIGFNGTLLKTINSGENWNLISTLTNNNLYGLTVIDENILIISGDNGFINKTINSGNTFTIITVPENTTVSEIQFFTSSTGYAQIGNYDMNNLFEPIYNKLYKSIDGGLTWLLVTNDFIDTFYFFNENIGFINKSENPMICKTNNGGLEFTNLNSSSSRLEKDFFSIDGNTVWDLSVSSLLCNCIWECVNKRETSDLSLVNEVNACNNTFYSGPYFKAIHFANSSSGYIVGLNGIIYKQTTGTNTLLDIVVFNNVKFVTISPNPVTDRINISFNKIIPKLFTIELTDVFGKIVFSKSYNEGINITIDSQNFTNGIYFLSFSNSESKQTQKLIINK